MVPWGRVVRFNGGAASAVCGDTERCTVPRRKHVITVSGSVAGGPSAPVKNVEMICGGPVREGWAGTLRETFAGPAAEGKLV